MVKQKNRAMERINALLDTDSFVETGRHIRGKRTEYNKDPAEAEGDGVITGYGLVNGRLVYIYSQDCSVLNGTLGIMHAKKIIKLYELALKSKSPVIGFLDCAGIRLSEGLDAMEGLGGIFKKQTAASGIIPQIVGIFGNCGGGLAFMNAFADFTFLENGNGKLFVNSPAVLEGNKELNHYPMHEEADSIGTAHEIIGKIRDLIRILPASNREDAELFKTNDDLNRMVPDIENYRSDGRGLLTSISDDGFFLEAKELKHPETVTGFIKLNGRTVGAIAACNQKLASEGCTKAREFVSFLDAFDIPLITFVNLKEIGSSNEEEKRIGKAAGMLAKVLIHSSIPKINLIIEKGIGSSYLVMNSIHIGADVSLAWEGSSVGAISSENAARVFCKEEKELSLIKQEEAKYEMLQNNPAYAAGEGYLDAIIAPEETRQRVIASLEMISFKGEEKPSKKHIVQ
ncbi:MAG: carboxyl transferase domain-containing protein [Lacrimispora sp.]|uniref:carboxyl transferase domain-containing protein n=1 Tax=Lacrimispora sp. TaxID=2719234 RepID=UPI0039E474D5